MSISRRQLLKQLGASSLMFVVAGEIFFGEKVSAETIRRFNDLDLIGLIKEMPKFEGIFTVETNILKVFADDFGHFIHRLPLGVLKPANAVDIQKMSEFCLEKKIKLTMRGVGGSAYGQTQLQEGIIIDSSSMKNIMWLSQDLIQLDPGLSWQEVLDYTLQSNRTPYVLPDTLVTSVGGTMNAGGFGETSYAFGSMASHVVEFDLVTIEGVHLTCNEEVNPELFQAALGSMGQFGFMTRIVLRTMAAPEKVYMRKYRYEGTDFQSIKDIQMLTQSELYAAIAGHLIRNADGKTFTYFLEITHWSEAEPQWLEKMSVPQSEGTETMSFLEYANRNTDIWKKNVSNGLTKQPHPFLSFYLPFAKTQEIAEYIQNTDSANRGASKITLMPIALHTEGELMILVRIYRIVHGGEATAEHLEMLRANEEIVLPKVYELGGYAYLPLSPLLSEPQKILQYGSEKWGAWQLLKHKYDTEILVNTGAGLF